MATTGPACSAPAPGPAAIAAPASPDTTSRLTNRRASAMPQPSPAPPTANTGRSASHPHPIAGGSVGVDPPRASALPLGVVAPGGGAGGGPGGGRFLVCSQRRRATSVGGRSSWSTHWRVAEMRAELTRAIPVKPSRPPKATSTPPPTSRLRLSWMSPREPWSAKVPHPSSVGRTYQSGIRRPKLADRAGHTLASRTGFVNTDDSRGIDNDAPHHRSEGSHLDRHGVRDRRDRRRRS